MAGGWSDSFQMTDQNPTENRSLSPPALSTVNQVPMTDPKLIKHLRQPFISTLDRLLEGFDAHRPLKGSQPLEQEVLGLNKPRPTIV